MKSTEGWLTRHLHNLLFLLALVCIGASAVVYGGLASIPKIGPLMQASAQREAPLVTMYMFIGERLNPALGWSDGGRQWAEDAFSQSFPRVQASPELAMDEIFSNTFNGSHRMVKFNHWAGPVLLILGLLRWWRRPKPVSLMRGR